ncbi:MAG: DUF4157 domain-containing protein [Bacteroidia bacterium]
MKSHSPDSSSAHSNSHTSKAFFEQTPSLPFFKSSKPIQQQAAKSSSVANKNTPKSSPGDKGLPQNLQAGVEQLSGHSMDDVNVHYNSDQPAALNAHAYAQGSEIHLAPGQEEHLPHEAWHVVQQKQGRVKPTTQLKGAGGINDEQGLEQEADLMGSKALQMKTEGDTPFFRKAVKSGVGGETIQRRRVVPDEEWEAFKLAKSTMKIFPNKEETSIGDLSLEQAYIAYDTYKTKGERFKEGKNGPGGRNTEDMGFSKDKLIKKEKIDNYLFIGLLEGDTVTLLATRGIGRRGKDGKGMAPIDWTAKEIKAAAETVQDNDADYRVEYQNEYSLKDGTLTASYNFGDSDEERYGPFKPEDYYINFAGEGNFVDVEDESDSNEGGESEHSVERVNREIGNGKRLSNSEILFYQMKMAQSLAGKNTKGFTPPAIIHRENIVNDDTLFVMLMSEGASFEKGWKWLKGGGVSKNPEDDYFAALGTPNGQSAGYIAQQHSGPDGNPTDYIDQIERQEKHLKISIKGVQLNPD